MGSFKKLNYKSKLLSKTIQKLIAQGEDPSEDDNWAISRAAENNQLAVVSILLQDPRVDPSGYRDYALRAAIGEGHELMVDILVKSGRVDVNCKYFTSPLTMAIRKQSLAMVKSLMLDTNLKITSDHIEEAVKGTSNIIILTLLDDKRVDVANVSDRIMKDPRFKEIYRRSSAAHKIGKFKDFLEL